MPDGVSGTLDTVSILVFLGLPGAILAGGALFVPWRSPVWSLDHWGRMLRRHGWVAAGLVAMLGPEIVESQVDRPLTLLLPWRDAPTLLLARLEGPVHHAIQAALAADWLRAPMTLVYVGGYPAIIILAVMVPLWLDDGRTARRALSCYALSFAAALPFYLLFPVDEVWHHDASVENIINSYPFVRDHLYSFNELNNCFPSLHTAISVALAAVVWTSPAPRRFRLFAAGLASGIVFSTVYLGIHWVTDVAAGLLLAAGVVQVSERWWAGSAPAPAVQVPRVAPKPPATL
jgi:membrane-associated phospholipid phosphatase